jgi:type II secretory ATPase GspE/PulE/Tfp pilus assembly ATPase PilB-like protein
VCLDCRVDHDPPEDQVREILGADASGIRWIRGRGCGRCNFTGYHGRVAVGELWVPSEEDVALINRRAPVEVLRQRDRASTVLMGEDARDKLRRGMTTLEEVERVLPAGVLRGPG